MISKMSRRVYIDDDEYVELPRSIVRAIDAAPRQPRRLTAAERREHRPIKAFANPHSWGYGGDETPWPFDYDRAINYPGYRAGIWRAINSSWTAQNWKHAARDLLAMVDAHLMESDYILTGRDPRFAEWDRLQAKKTRNPVDTRSVRWRFGPPPPKPKYNYFRRR